MSSKSRKAKLQPSSGPMSVCSKPPFADVHVLDSEMRMRAFACKDAF